MVFHPEVRSLLDTVLVADPARRATIPQVWMDGLMHGWMDGWMDGWVTSPPIWMDGWMTTVGFLPKCSHLTTWMNTYIHPLTHPSIYHPSIHPHPFIHPPIQVKDHPWFTAGGEFKPQPPQEVSHVVVVLVYIHTWIDRCIETK